MASIIVEGQRYPVVTPDDLTLGEMEDAAKLGVNLNAPNGGMDPTWIRAMIMIAKQRAGEPVDAEALRGLRFADLEFEEDEADADPPTNRAARRAGGGRAAKNKPGGSRAPTRAASGLPASDTTSTSAPAT